MTRKHVLVLILIAYLVLGTVYSLVTPILESSDEFKHYPFVQYVQTEQALPVLDATICTWPGPESCPWLQDGGQPPAYYVLMGALTTWIDTSDIHKVRWMNPHAFVGDPYITCNENLLIHIPERERFPWHGSVLAIHVIRLLTVLIGAGTVMVTYLLACDLFPEQKWLALGATALTAFTPMFLFVNSAVNNDSLAALIGCFTLLIFVRMVRDGQQRPLSPWRYAGIGGLIGLFMLTKLSGLGALILAGFLLAWISYRRRSLRPLLVGFPIILGVAALISGWWFLRNWRLYGDLTGLNEFIEIQGRRPGIPTLEDWVDEFVSFRWTYWGLFGAVNVMAPRWLYTFFDVFSLVAIAGLGAWVVRSWRSPGPDSGELWWVPALWIGVLFVSVLRWTWIYFSFQGRLIFPAIAGVNTLIMVGLREWIPSRWHRELTLALSGLFFVIAAALPFVSILPAYARPEPMTLAEVPPQARVEPVDMDGVARVVGWEMEPQTVTEGEEVEFVVYWESVAPDGSDYLSFARLLGREHELAGQVNRHPASGTVPTSLWEPGQVWRDRYRVEVAEDVRAPTRLRVEVGLYDAELGRTLGVARVGEAKLPPPEDCPTVPQSLAVDLADGVTLTGFGLEPQSVRAGETVTLTLYWEARSAPSRDYTVFVHLLDRSGEPVHFGDAPPLEGDYPTGMWAAGECIVDPHPLTLPLDLPAGEYDLLVGMYNLDTMRRLQRLDRAGDRVGIPIPVEVR